jgi:hypothetical protein
MKPVWLSLFLGFGLLGRVYADLTIVQNVEGPNRPGGEMTIRIKGEMARIDASPKISAIANGKTGEVLTLMKDQKMVLRISAERMKAAAEMLKKFKKENTEAGAAKPKATGRKETINGYMAEEYTLETPNYKAVYWIAPSFPDGAAILKQLRAVKSELWNSANGNAPDFRDFPGLPVRSVIDMGGTQVTTTLVSVKQDPLSDADFAVPSDFKEIKPPDLGSMPESDKEDAEEAASPHP